MFEGQWVTVWNGGRKDARNWTHAPQPPLWFRSHRKTFECVLESWCALCFFLSFLCLLLCLLCFSFSLSSCYGAFSQTEESSCFPCAFFSSKNGTPPLQGERCNHAHGPQDLREPKSKAGCFVSFSKLWRKVGFMFPLFIQRLTKLKSNFWQYNIYIYIFLTFMNSCKKW